VALRQRADFVLIPVLISSWTKNKKISLNIKRKIMDNVLKKAAENPDIMVIPAGSPQPVNKACASAVRPKKDPRGKRKPDFLLLAQLRGRGRNIAACAAMMRKFLLSIPRPDGVSWCTRSRRLVVENPEQYRPKLLEMISKSVSNTRENVKNGKVNITGLERPVCVRQVDGGNVEFFINYQVSAEVIQ